MKKSPAVAPRPRRSNVRVAYDAIQAEIRETDLHLARAHGRRDALRELRDRLSAIVRPAEADRASTGEGE